jgi:hypothetical protein
MTNARDDHKLARIIDTVNRSVFARADSVKASTTFEDLAARRQRIVLERHQVLQNSPGYSATEPP